MFDLQQWLLGVDTSGADKSLDEEAARLLVLNHVLVDESSGPILASLIVSTEGDHGLHALPPLARGSEPRFVAMALLNIMYVLGYARTGTSEFSYNPSNGDPSQEVILTEADLPSPEYVRTQIAAVMNELCEVFLEKVAEGDFCGDFLTYLLAVLLDLAKDTSENRELELYLRRVQSQQFLKAVVRTWKSSELSSHVVTAEHEEGLNLGFLVSCYLKSICSTTRRYTAQHREMRHSRMESARGMDALIAMDDWLIKFITMRLYQTNTTQPEREHLITVLDDCMTQSTAFGYRLVELDFPTVLRDCLQLLDEVPVTIDSTIPEDVCSMQTKDLYPCYNILHDICQLLWLDAFSSQTGHTLSYGIRESQYFALWGCIKILTSNTLSTLIRTNFTTNSTGRLLKKSVISLILKVISLAWRVNILQLEDLNRTSREAVCSQFHTWIEATHKLIDENCDARQTSWDAFTQPCEVAPLRTALAICESLLIEDGVTTHEPSSIHTDRSVGPRNLARNICEWCLQNRREAKLCSDCQRVSYCCTEHQRAHWRAGHKTECAFLRNTLSGCSFIVEDCLTLAGLEIHPQRVDPSSTRAAFETVERSQREELLFLSVRLPGILSQVVSDNGTMIAVRYITRAQLQAEVELSAQIWSWDVNRRIVAACLKTTSQHMVIQIRECAQVEESSHIGLGLQQVWVHFSGYDETHSLCGAPCTRSE